VAEYRPVGVLDDILTTGTHNGHAGVNISCHRRPPVAGRPSPGAVGRTVP
jgi:hypothetical protein